MSGRTTSDGEQSYGSSREIANIACDIPSQA